MLGKLTLEEAFTSKKPNLGHIHIFGCLVYCHIPMEKITKLEPTTEKGILVGYNETSKAYWICIPALKKIVFHRDVKLEV